MITAEEFIQKNQRPLFNEKGGSVVQHLMIEFAKLHVIEALKQASEKAEIIYESHRRDGPYTSTMESSHYTEDSVDKDSILNAYDLDNIK